MEENQHNYPHIYFVYPSKLLEFCKKNSKGFLLLDLTNGNTIIDEKSSNIIILERKKLDKEKLMKDYMEFIGTLNKRYNSLLWWAGSIPSKNQFVSPLFKNICRFLQFIDAIEIINEKEIVVLIDNKDLIRQIRYYCKQKKIKVNFIGWKTKILTISIIQSVKLITANTYFLGLGWWKKYLVNKYLKGAIEEGIDNRKKYYVLRTWVDKRAFDSENNFRDIYFGKLDGVLQNKKNTIILAGVLSDFKKNLIKIRNNISNNFIIPQDYFLTYLDYLKIIFLQFRKEFVLPINIKFSGVNIDYLVENEICNNLYKGELRNNLRYYFIAKNLSKWLKCEIFAYTFENHPWEKMSILGLRKYSKDTFILGYQHSSIVKYLFNYFNSKAEIDVIPFPDKIITVGKIPKKILAKYCGYNKGMIKEGCALRYEYLYKIDAIERNRKSNILIATSASIDESIKVIKFVYSALKETTYAIIFRPHPLLNFEQIKEKLGLTLGANFKVSKNRSIKDDLRNSDILIYTQTSLCMEALMIGIPIIYVDINEFYNCDPLFECNHLKWIVDKEENLIRTINEIYNMDDKEFNRQQRLARKYMENYFLPVTDKRLKEFIKK